MINRVVTSRFIGSLDAEHFSETFGEAVKELQEEYPDCKLEFAFAATDTRLGIYQNAWIIVRETY